MVRLNDQSFRLLLNLEWLLLVTAVFMELLLPFHGSWAVLGRIIAIAIFGFMGLRLPTGKLPTKLIYTALEFSLILLPATQVGLSNRSVFLLCLVLVMRSCLIFKQLGQIAVLILSLVTYASLLLSKPMMPGRSAIALWEDWRLSNILLFSLTLIFALLLTNALLAERGSREQLETVYQELETTHQQLRHYALRIEDQATLQERNRIAREIHDGLGHTLAAQTIHMNNAILFWKSDSDKALMSLKQSKQLGAEALLEVRKSVSVLRSNPLQGFSLETAIQKLLHDFQHTTGIEVCYTFQLAVSLPTEINTTLYRIVQESLTNITKHAQAKKVNVDLHQQASLIHLAIADDGKGFTPTENTTGFGLQGMRERAAALNGTLHIHSQPEKGCYISVSLPSLPH
ncbi:MAG: sensor histidine kinase [Leptolyngbya sp.]|nr:MAG: sensor histidine kinase [Leptolyngbya sp.]